MITTKASITLYACPLSFRSSQDKGRLGGLADLEAWTLVQRLLRTLRLDLYDLNRLSRPRRGRRMTPA
jgi:hypothetical protein